MFNESVLVNLNEGMEGFSYAAKAAVFSIFGVSGPPIKVKGKKKQIEAFARAIKTEARYLKVVKKYGLNSPITYRHKYRLDVAVRKFEEETGIKWPFTDER